jgi:hypothetical protein
VSHRERKKVEMLFAHPKRSIRLGRLRLRGPRGAKDEFLSAATGPKSAETSQAHSLPARSSPPTLPSRKPPHDANRRRAETEFFNKIGRVGVWRGGVRLSISVCRPFRLAVPYWLSRSSVSTPPSSNRACRFPASGSRTRPHAFVHGTSCPRRLRLYEPEGPVEVRKWIAPAPSSPDFVLGAQPPAQPHRCVSVEHPIRLIDGSYLEVVRPSAQRAVHFAHQRCGLLPCSRSVGQRVDFLHHALNAFL